MKPAVKYFAFLFIPVILLSSCNRNQSWLKEYRAAKCSWQNAESALSKDTLQSNEKLHLRLAEIKTEIEKVQTPFQNRISAIERNIKQTRQRYFDEYNRMTDAHNQIYGHKSTPEYDRKVATNEAKKNTEVATLQAKIYVIKQELEENRLYKEWSEKLKSALTEIESNNATSKQKFKPTFDSLQIIIDKSNQEFRDIIAGLKESERQSLIDKRDSIRANPCLNLNEKP